MSAPLAAVQLRAGQLAGLGEWLRDRKFRVGTQQLLQAEQLLLRLAATGLLPDQPAQLASHLGPRFCATPEQQQRFPEIFEEWLEEEFRDAPFSASAGEPLHHGGGPSAPQRPPWRWLLGGSVLALLLLAGLVAAYFWWPQELPGVGRKADGHFAAGAQITLGSVPFTVPADGRFLLSFRRSDLPRTLTITLTDFAPIETKIQPPVPKELVFNLVPLAPTNRPTIASSTNATAATNAPAPPAVNAQPMFRPPRPWQQHVKFAAYASSPLVLLLLWWGIRRAWWHFRGTPHLQRLCTETPPKLREVRVSGGAVTLLPGLGVRELGRELRRRRRVHSRELDLPATLTATLANGGLLAPVFGSRVEPNYLVLNDRASLQEHQAALTALVVDTLLLGNVLVERYYYDGDPGFCRRAEDRADDRTGAATAQTVTLEELAARLPDHRLLSFSDGTGFFDGFTGQPAPWVQLLAAWDDKAILTPEPPQHWGRREWAIEKLGFLLLPISRAGLTLLGDFFRDRPVPALAHADAHQKAQPSFARHSARWLDREPPAPDQVEKLCAELQDKLGETAFHWLCACAV